MRLLVALLLSVGLVREAAALTACTAAQVSSQDSSCPNGPGPCTITKDFTIGDGCVLDFGTRAVTLSPTAKLTTAPGSITIKAGTFTIAGGGFIDGRGVGAPVDRGGLVRIETTGAVAVQRNGGSSGRIDVSGDAGAGTIQIVAGGAVTIGGELSANKLSSAAGGGSIIVDAGGDITTGLGSVLSAIGGTGASGEVDLTAGGRIELGDAVDITGDSAGSLGVFAGADAVVRRVRGDAFGDAGSGGEVTIDAGLGTRLLDVISLKGSSSIDGTTGGCGGAIDVVAGFGELDVKASILAEGAGPDGTGGDVSFVVDGTTTIDPGVVVSGRSNGGQGDGGTVEIDADFDIDAFGFIDASGGLGGGGVDVTGRGNVAIVGGVTAQGFSDGGFGGDVTIEAGFGGKGNLTIDGVVDARGGACNDLNGCGFGGITDLAGCDVTVGLLGRVLASANSGGDNAFEAREQLTILGEVTATGVSSGDDGTNRFRHRTAKPPVVTGPVTPAATPTDLATCTAPGQPACIAPCPTCGDGVIEYPETCDDLGAPQSCDGCSTFCRAEECDDGSICTGDSCSPTRGCRNVALPNGSSCSDGLVCNGPEQCSFGACVDRPNPDCNDGNPCTTDGCAEPGGCFHTPLAVGTGCSDGNACTIGDACNASGVCTPTGPLVCDDVNECTNDSCNTTTGCVFANRTGACTDDGNFCTNDVCSAGACAHPNKPNGTGCDDGQFCTIADACQGGTCTPNGSRNCADTNACTSDTCDDVGDVCLHDPIVPCCGNGAFEPEGGEECDDGNTSNTDGCTNACRLPVCGDGFVHAGVEQCDRGAANADTPNALCRTDCTLPRCGDAITDDLRGEQCDDGATLPDDGCSAACFIEPPPTAVLIAGRGSPVTDCALEWAIENPTLDRRGLPSAKQTCGDGDACDHGGAAGECVFHIWLCANNHDPLVPLCTPGPGGVGTLVGVEVKKPSRKDVGKRVEDAQNQSELSRASSATAQLGAFDACGPRMELRVPLKAPDRQGSKKLKLRGSTGNGVTDSDALKLICVP